MQLASSVLRGFCALPPMRIAAVILPWWVEREALVLTRRASRGGAFNSMWVFPGGALDAGETPEEAAARELSEETGLRVRSDSLGFLCAYQARCETLCLTYLMLIYSADADGELLLQQREVEQAAFLPRSTVSMLLSGLDDGSV